MSHDPAGTALLKRQAITPAAIAALGVALGLYQATSLTLGPAGERQISISLSAPASLDLSLPNPPASQLVDVGQALAGRVERGLASFAVLRAKPLLGGRIGVAPTASNRGVTPAASAVPAPASASAPGPQPVKPAGHSATSGHSGSGTIVAAAHGDRPVLHKLSLQ